MLHIHYSLFNTRLIRNGDPKIRSRIDLKVVPPSSLMKMKVFLRYKLPDHSIIFARWRQQTRTGEKANFAMNF